MHKELAELEGGQNLSEGLTGTLEELRWAVTRVCSPHWSASLDPRGATRREEAVHKILTLTGSLELAQQEHREKLQKEEEEKKTQATMLAEGLEYEAETKRLLEALQVAETEATHLDTELAKLVEAEDKQAQAACEEAQGAENTALPILIVHNKRKNIRDINLKFKDVREATLLAVTHARRSLKEHQLLSKNGEGEAPPHVETKAGFQKINQNDRKKLGHLATRWLENAKGNYDVSSDGEQ